jgi:hypothetical protein
MITDLDHMYEGLKKDRVIQSQNLEELRVASESEFNGIKKAEIADFKKLNGKINEVLGLQDIVEQIAGKLQHLQLDIDGVRDIKNHSPVIIKNKVGSGNMTSAMTPSTMLFSDLKNRRTYEIDEGYESGLKIRHRNVSGGRSISFENLDRRGSPTTDRVRESLFTRSRLSKYLANDYVNRDREYIQIENENVHRHRDLARRLQGDSLTRSGNLNTLKDMRNESYMPHSYKLKDNLGDDKKLHKSGNKDRKPKRRDSQSSKYSYDKKKEVMKNLDNLHKGGVSVDSGGKSRTNYKPSSPNKSRSPNKSYSFEESSESEDKFSREKNNKPKVNRA